MTSMMDFALLRKTIFVSFSFLVISITGFSQTRWTLEQCVEYAIQNNIQLKQSKLSVDVAAENLQQSRANLLPSINGYGSHNFNYGRTIDPLTNLFATNQVQSNNFGLSTNMTLFSGMQNINSIKQNEQETQTKKFDLENAENDVRINVINAYLQILFAEEILAVNKGQINVTKQQLLRVKKLVEVGSSAKGAQFEIEAQLASEELQVVNSQNQLDLAYLNIIQLLNIDNADGFEIARPIIDISGDNLVLENPSTIYQLALSNQPSIKSAESSIFGTQHALKVAKGGLSPRISFNASYGSGYSQLRKEPMGAPSFNGFDTIAYTTSNEAVIIPNYTSDLAITSFSNQVTDNLNKTFGFSVNVPIFNGLSTKTRIAQAKISVENAKYNLELNKQFLRNAIQKSHADASAAYKKYKATETSLKALKEAFFYTEQRFNVGMVNPIEYNDSKNKLTKTESDLLQAKFDYVFKVKILDYYLGKPVVL